ncbi:MAG: carbon storage regulator [Lachnospiraceae bacterium]|nr:carbon storage regulator [Lachnospiraceae bacterium]
MLRFTIRAGEYFNIGNDIRVVILGGCANNCRVMVDAPREYNIVRGKVLERNAVTAEDKEKLHRYYPEPKLSPEVVRKMIAKQRQEPDVRKEAGRA